MSATIRAPGRVITVGEACLKRNPDLFRKLDPEAMHILNTTPIGKPRKKRIRQRSSTGLNKLETEALMWLGETYAHASLRPHAIRLEIANGCYFTPDIVMVRGCDMILYEVKGKHAWDDAIVKLKVVARAWPHFNFALIWKEEGRWMEQAIFP